MKHKTLFNIYQLHHYKVKFCTSKYPIVVEDGNYTPCEELFVTPLKILLLYLLEINPSDSNKRGNFSGALIYNNNLGNFAVILQADVRTSFVPPGWLLSL